MRKHAPLPLELEGDDVVLREDAQTWDNSGVAANSSHPPGEIPDTIHGSTQFKAAFQLLASEYSGVFSRTLKAEPANIPPLVLDVDETKWHVPSNTAAPRLHSVTKGDEIARQVAQMTEINLIERSLAPYHKWTPPPLVLDADAEETKWYVPRHTATPRLHSVADSDEIAKQIAQITEITLIERPLAPISQVTSIWLLNSMASGMLPSTAGI
jgi:hypothetical protein